jgi:glyoxylase I family protein
VQTFGFHHLALFGHDIEILATFYGEVFGLNRVATHTRPDGQLRSIWMAWETGPVPFIALEQEAVSHRANDTGLSVLMLNLARAERSAFKAHLQTMHISVERETPYSMYFRDPEGNRVGVSHYPDLFSPT